MKEVIMRYSPSRGGHAPGHLREAFVEWVEGGADPTGVSVEVGYVEQVRPVRWIVGQLWNCTDVLPWYACDGLDIPRGSSYAQAVRSTWR
jgi:hypothetical protein